MASGARVQLLNYVAGKVSIPTCHRWSKDFLEAGKKRLSGDTVREANTDEVTGLRRENSDLKQAVAELYLRNDWLMRILAHSDH